MANQAAPIIEISGLRFQYRQSEFCLQIADLSVERESAVAMIGPSGSGKTSLLHLIAGILTPSEGRIVTDGQVVTALNEAERRRFRIRNLGLVFQEFELVEYLDLTENLLMTYRIHPDLELTDAVRGRARELLERVGLGPQRRRFIHQLSQGERQRVAICRALLPQADLLLADEPTGNLDPTVKTAVLDILFDEVKSRGVTLVTVTHDHGILERFDRVIDFQQFHAHPVSPERGGECGAEHGGAEMKRA